MALHVNILVEAAVHCLPEAVFAPAPAPAAASWLIMQLGCMAAAAIVAARIGRRRRAQAR